MYSDFNEEDFCREVASDFRSHKIKCPRCGHEDEYYGGGYNGLHECVKCEGWMNLFGQAVYSPYNGPLDCEEDW